MKTGMFDNQVKRANPSIPSIRAVSYELAFANRKNCQINNLDSSFMACIATKIAAL